MNNLYISMYTGGFSATFWMGPFILFVKKSGAFSKTRLQMYEKYG